MVTMDQTRNPYSPGAGLRPPALVGRDAELELVHTMIYRAASGLHARGVILYGLRGVGKTVLLNEMANLMEQADWLVIQLEAGAGAGAEKRLRTRLARELGVGARKIVAKKRWSAIKKALPTISAFSMKLAGIELVLDGAKAVPGRGDSGDISIDLEEVMLDVAEAAQKDGKGVAIFIDEMQDTDPDMLSALNMTQHRAGQKGLPFFVFGAGLPTLPQCLAESQSYAERLYEYRNIGPLKSPEAKEALVEPAAASNVEYQEKALKKILKASGNYPYFLQEYGKAAWDVATQSPITAEDAKIAIGAGMEQLDSGFFLSRWERATPSEKRLLLAMAKVPEEEKAVAEVVSLLGVTNSTISNARKALIRKGLLYSPRHGYLAFTVPGMEGFLTRNSEFE